MTMILQSVTDGAARSEKVENRRVRGSLPLCATLVALAVGMTAVSVLGPLVLGAMTYRTSPTSLNQLLGSDAASLFILAPLTLVAAALALRGHRAATPLASGIGAFAIYTYAQVVIGEEYLRLPGNVEDFFPLLLGIFVLAEVALVLSWRAMPSDLPPPSRGLQRTSGWVLLVLAVFLVLGLHLPSMLTAWTDPQSLTQYASSPTPFWLVKLMDLGIIVPAAVAVGAGLLRGASWALRVLYPLLTAYTCLAFSVTAMAVVMLVNGDPDASVGLTAGFGLFALGFLMLTVLLYWPLLAHAPDSPRPQPVER